MGTMASQISLTIVYSTVYGAQINDNIKAPGHWPLWGEFTGDRWIPHTKGQLHGNFSFWWHQHIHVHNKKHLALQLDQWYIFYANWYSYYFLVCPGMMKPYQAWWNHIGAVELIEDWKKDVFSQTF